MNSFYHHEQHKCQSCEKKIQNNQFKIQYGDYFYHKECYKCKCCAKIFPVLDNFSNVNLIPLQDKYGGLYCQQDFITTLKCSLCLNKFDSNSMIFKLNDTEYVEHLVHSECVSCDNCKSKLEISSEYMLEKDSSENSQKFNLCCKVCKLKKFNKSTGVSSNMSQNKKNKKMLSVHHRLSSRQKEILIEKLLTLNGEINANDSKDLLDNLAIEIRCSKKSLVNYIDKHLKNHASKDSIQNMDNKNQITSMIDELNKLDKTLAPNQFPFGQFSKKMVCSAKTSENKNLIC